MEQTQNQNPTPYQFPTEEVTLPSQGLLYPADSPLRKGVIEMKYMTAKEEDILTNQNLIKQGNVIDKLLQSLIVTPFDFKELLLGDKNAILVAARILGYGAEYDCTMINPTSGEEEKVRIDLTQAEDVYIDKSKIIDGKNEFEFILPKSKIPITFQFMTHGLESKIDAELKGLKKINKKSHAELSTRLKHIILAVDGDRDKKTIREFVDQKFLAMDARALRNYISDISPDINLKFDIEFEDGHVQEGVDIPVTIQFFWPDAGI
tara:strand:- start:396 stop:1184 length:789 start_codon:yes stop_codon:yes gene_type:complete